MGANSTKGKSYNCPPMNPKRLKETHAIAARFASIGINMTGLKKNPLSKVERTTANKARRLAKHIKNNPNDLQATGKVHYSKFAKRDRIAEVQNKLIAHRSAHTEREGCTASTPKVEVSLSVLFEAWKTRKKEGK